jgi:hypothetical protein
MEGSPKASVLSEGRSKTLYIQQKNWPDNLSKSFKSCSKFPDTELILSWHFLPKAVISGSEAKVTLTEVVQSPVTCMILHGSYVVLILVSWSFVQV